jgi:hypothetical protein
MHPGIRRELLLLLHLFQPCLIFGEGVFGHYRRNHATQLGFKAQVRLETPEDARHKDAGVNP